MRSSKPQPGPSRSLIEDARRTLARHASPTPLVPMRSLPGVHLKLETFSPTGSFKWRGVLYRLLQLGRRELRNGVVTASTGNHGFAVAWAAAKLGAPATVFVPRGTPRFKRERIMSAGAHVLVAGGNWNESLLMARRLAVREGLVPIEDGEDEVLMAGTATLGLEILDDLPDVKQIVAPVGGGNLIAAIACALEARRSKARLIGVQSSTARGAFDSWKADRIAERPVDTIAGGIATSSPVPFAFEIMRRRVDDMALVSDADMLRAVGRLALSEGIVAEPSAAAPAAYLFGKGRVTPGTVMIVTGNSIEARMLEAAVKDPSRIGRRRL